jgi:hypothetical protein
MECQELSGAPPLLPGDVALPHSRARLSTTGGRNGWLRLFYLEQPGAATTPELLLLCAERKLFFSPVFAESGFVTGINSGRLGSALSYLRRTVEEP